MVDLGGSWDMLREEFQKEYYLSLRQRLKEEYARYTVYPDIYDIFNALRFTPYEEVRVVILGQDPYHGPGQAHGLSFSVKPGVPPPPSLQNMLRELNRDLGCAIPGHGCLEGWARQGVLLLNTALTVREASPNSHRGMGWEVFTDRVIQVLDSRETPLVFLLWGANARDKTALITNPAHLILTAPHPSPLSAHRGFFGCGHFSKANAFLREKGLGEIDWQL